MSEVVHAPSTMISFDSGKLFESATDPTIANSHSPLIARDSCSEMTMSSIQSRSIDVEFETPKPGPLY